MLNSRIRESISRYLCDLAFKRENCINEVPIFSSMFLYEEELARELSHDVYGEFLYFTDQPEQIYDTRYLYTREVNITIFLDVLLFLRFFAESTLFWSAKIIPKITKFNCFFGSIQIAYQIAVVKI